MFGLNYCGTQWLLLVKFAQIVFRTTIGSPYYSLEIIDMVISCLKVGTSEPQSIETIYIIIRVEALAGKSAHLSVCSEANKMSLWLKFRNICQLRAFFNHGNSCLFCLKLWIIPVWIPVCVHIEGIAFTLASSWIKIYFKMESVLVVFAV